MTPGRESLTEANRRLRAQLAQTDAAVAVLVIANAELVAENGRLTAELATYESEVR